jgi:hypothetical protein
MDLKDLILKAKDSSTLPVVVPEWNTTVHIRVMRGDERDLWESQVFKDGRANPDKLRAKLLVRCIADEQGNRVFSDSDLEALASKSGIVLSRLFDVAMKHNGLGKEDVTELVKN